jgi:hypothetical protein
MFPNLWMRTMSAWIGMMAVFSLAQFSSLENVNRLGVATLERRLTTLKMSELGWSDESAGGAKGRDMIISPVFDQLWVADLARLA